MWGIDWSDEALDDLEEITSYVRDFSPAAAARLELAIVEAADSLETLPNRGRATGPNSRELTVVQPYLIRYVVVGAEVRILSVRHAARRREPRGR
ncbi:MAG: toxin ParE1/3/4 [Brevundimonas sp.]|jgi:toxin ParE1/3/4|uniref:type II toxin-antitoxin system RelE/ParE family toxin n=1 Tax=Brevundimonas sp. TaxID=1871086 RepID=UPI0039E29A07